MITESSTKDELLAAMDTAVAELVSLMAPLNEGQVNTVPFAGGWNAGQLFRHVTKSTNGMVRALLAEARPAMREPAENVGQLRRSFLDFSTKMKSPAFIVPEDEYYEKEQSVAELDTALQQLRASAERADLQELVKGLPLGDVTKLEILHFVVYHTQRHVQQMRKIQRALLQPAEQPHAEGGTLMDVPIGMNNKKPDNKHMPVNPTVAQRGVPGFHNKIEPGDDVPLAAMELDVDTEPERVNTETGDQPGNAHGSRFRTPSTPDEKE